MQSLERPVPPSASCVWTLGLLACLLPFLVSVSLLLLSAFISATMV